MLVASVEVAVVMLPALVTVMLPAFVTVMLPADVVEQIAKTRKSVEKISLKRFISFLLVNCSGLPGIAAQLG